MASLVAVRFKPKPQTLRRLFSSSATPPPPPSDQVPPEDPSAAPFTDIKARLRRLAAEPRRIPLNPPKPDILSQNTETTSLDDIRKHLAEFRSRSAAPSPSSVPKHQTSFQDLYRKSLLNRSADAEPPKPPATISYDSIRESLRLFRDKGSPGSGLSSSFREAADAKGSPTPRMNVPGRTEGLPRSIFGRELEKKDEGKGRRTDFLKAYSYEELGEKLRMLRPKGGDGKEVSFSLEELKERLVSLREMEEKGSGAMSGVGFDFASLRDSLQSMQQAKNNSNLTRMLFLSHIGGEVTPDYMLRPPKEQLVEKYFHPDLMSSAEKIKLELKSVRDEFKMSESDCGSARVQVAQLTTKIKHLSSVLHKKDKHSQKGLQAMVQRRKKLLKYLRRTDWESYCFVLSKLGLRDAADYRT